MIYLMGASGHTKVVLEILEKRKANIGGLVNINPSITTLFNYDVYQELPSSFNFKNDEIIISIGNNAIRKKIATSAAYKYTSAIHDHTSISERAKIGEGIVIMAGVSINADAQIGKHTIINTNASIDHDCILDDYVHISPNVALAGDVYVGEGTHIGIGACVIQGIRIGKWCTIGAGSVIIKDVPDGVTVVGNPGRIIKQ